MPRRKPGGVDDMSNEALFRLAGLGAVPVHRDGTVYYRAHKDSATRGDVVVNEYELAALIRDWWKRGQKGKRQLPTLHNGTEK